MKTVDKWGRNEVGVGICRVGWGGIKIQNKTKQKITKQNKRTTAQNENNEEMTERHEHHTGQNKRRQK